ncbi:tyrosine-type recombinase/integrase [Streptomyces recifensis]|uniref:tyrosine-type recombinase/integrase n=1 Tax=Streptomyces recifensis TaxID=67355 RepID=UPI003CC60436
MPHTPGQTAVTLTPRGSGWGHTAVGRCDTRRCGRRPLRYKALYQMVKRRADQAGYDPDEVTPHSLCHTWAHDLLDAGVAGENVMAIRGWSSPVMLRRYGADQASQRAITAVHALGDRYS